jgi:hypothetical protein
MIVKKIIYRMSDDDSAMMDLNDDFDDCADKDNYVNVFLMMVTGCGDGGDVSDDGGNNIIEMMALMLMMVVVVDIVITFMMFMMVIIIMMVSMVMIFMTMMMVIGNSHDYSND